jgi:AcrR family transcriptional regulator
MQRARSESQKQQRREEILRAVIAQFEEHGFAGATLRQIAQRAGLTQATLYRYFEDKEVLLFAVFDHELEQSAAVGHARAAAQTAPVEKLRAYLQGYAGYWLANPLSYANVFTVRTQPYRVPYAPTDAPRQGVERLLLEAGFDAARAKLSLNDASLTLLLAVQGVPALYLGGKAYPWPDSAPLLDVILDGVFGRLRL